MIATQGILAALLERERTGLGQQIDVAMLDASAALLTYQAGIYFATGRTPTRRGNAHPTIVPYSTYPSADGSLIVAVGNDTLFGTFCEVVGVEEVSADPRFATAAARVEHREELDQILCDLLGQRPRDHWIELLRRHGIPCGAVRDVSEVCGSAQLKARGMVQQVQHARAGTVGQLGSPIHLSRSAGSPRMPPPLLGQHTQEILESMLGLSAADVQQLREEGVV
jgi:formyl-CoA transferase